MGNFDITMAPLAALFLLMGVLAAFDLAVLLRKPGENGTVPPMSRKKHIICAVAMLVATLLCLVLCIGGI